MGIARNKVKPEPLTLEELIAKSNGAARKKPQHRESEMQMQCVYWFRLQYPTLALNLNAVPNGGNRSEREAGILKGEGVTAGVADLILFVPNSTYHCLCIELKYGKQGRQADTQKEWQKAIEKHGYKYALIRSFDDFKTEIKNYLK